MTLFQEIIRHKRDGGALPEHEIADMVRGISDGSAGEGQIAAFAMAVFLNGMDTAETVALTRAMRDSGTVITWDRDRLGGPVLDKHSTGGVGDKASLMLAPIIAACGGFVPTISGRGLGHTGGTLDKLDTIPGYQTTPDLATFQRVVRETGCAIIGQTADLAPADRRLYAVRDVTATVESVPLITASILSKKLAAGPDRLVMDVKTGSGAFMETEADARHLAQTITNVATGAGLATTALLTDMNQVLGDSAGNALEIREAVDYLTGAAREARLDAVVRALAREMLLAGDLAGDAEMADDRVDTALDDGSAAERFAAMVAALGGPPRLMEEPELYLPPAEITVPAFAEGSGFIQSVDTRMVGLAVVELGGGRRRAEDEIDPSVGLSRIKGVGDAVGPDHPLALIHAASHDAAERAAATLRTAFRIGGEVVKPGLVIIDRIEATP